MNEVPQPSPAPITTPSEPPKPPKKLGAVSLVFSILGLIFAIFPIIGFVLGIISLILAILFIKKGGLSGGFAYTVALLAGFATFFGAVTLIVFIAYGGELLTSLGL